MTRSRMECDVAIAGGGPAGAIAALTLVSVGADVVLIEGSRYAEPRVGEMLPPSARPLLVRLGVWETVAALGAKRSHGHESAWGGPELAARPFIFHPHGHGWHLDRARFDAMLAARAADAGAHLLDGVQVSRCDQTPENSFELKLRNGDASDSTLSARAVIDADRGVAPCLPGGLAPGGSCWIGSSAWRRFTALHRRKAARLS